MIRMVRAGAFLLLLFPSLAAALPEICGNGIDDDGAGGDALCPDPDKDNDGYLAGADCDDTNYKIYPGVLTGAGCSAGQWRRCQSDGTFTPCSGAVACEAASGSTCKYIDCGSGSDSSGDGSYSNPWKSFRMVGFRADASQNPPGWYGVKPGDVIYLKGSGTCTDTYNMTSGEPTVVVGMGVSGEPGKPITYKRYPGSTAVIDPPFSSSNEGHVLYLRNASYIKLEDIDLTGSYGGMIYGGGNTNIEIARMRCHDSQGNNDHNIACINLAAGPTNVVIHHNEIFNIYDPAQPGQQNVGLVVFFGGQDNRVEYNRFYYTNSPAYGGPMVGRCLRYKHPGTAGTFTVKGNQFWNCDDYAFENSTHGVRMTNNLFVNPPDYPNAAGYGCWDIGAGISYCRDGLIENNTFVNARAFELQTSGINSGLGTTTFRSNVIIHSTPSYGPENAVVRIARYGSDADFALFNSVHGLVSSSNCYYNPNTALTYDFFGDAPLSTGGMYSFSQWQGAGFDSGSVSVNPGLDGVLSATGGGCAGRGWTAATSSRPAPPTNLQVTVMP